LFSAIAPETKPLLTISIPVGLQFGKNPGNILGNTDNLQLKPGKTFALVGGDVRLDNFKFKSSGAQLELGGLVEPGIVGFNLENNPNLTFPEGVKLASVSLNKSNLSLNARNGNGININAGNIDIINSFLTVGVDSGIGGDITLNATNDIKIQSSRISNIVNKNGQGKAGNSNLRADEILFVDSKIINQLGIAATGNTGDINIQVRSLSMNDTFNLNGNTIFSTDVKRDALGNAGNITINTDALSLNNGAKIASYSDGNGETGNIFINANKTLILLPMSWRSRRADKFLLRRKVEALVAILRFRLQKV
jgi:large exoprotein involved in heme utilization and adhesion